MDSDGNLRLLRPSAEDLVLEDLSDSERGLVEALDGSQTTRQLEERFGMRLVEEAVAQLRGVDVLDDAADDDLVPLAERTRFDSQLRYFSDVGHAELPASECQARLREARVAVIGVGGLGSRAALDLACCGVGELWVADGDKVEESNLNRQILYTESDIGRLKAEAAAARLLAFNSSMRVKVKAQRLESKAEVVDFISGADIVVDAADWPAHDIERWCNAACFEAGIPYITMSHFPPIARVGPLYVPGRTGCYICQETSYRRAYPMFDTIVEHQRATPSSAATLGPACGLISGQVGMEVMHLLTGLSEPATLGVAHVYNLKTMEVRHEKVVPEPECPVCSMLLLNSAPV